MTTEPSGPQPPTPGNLPTPSTPPPSSGHPATQSPATPTPVSAPTATGAPFPAPDDPLSASDSSSAPLAAGPARPPSAPGSASEFGAGTTAGAFSAHGPGGEVPANGAGRQRLHPISPVLKGLRLLVLAVVAMSWRTLQQLEIGNWLLLVLGLSIVLLIYSAVAWRFTGYEVARRELRIYEGVLSRRVRTVPLERLQAIEVVQPFQAKPFGLAELKLDVAGTQKAEAPLAYLPLAQARALRAQLLALSAGAGGATQAPEEPAAEPVLRVDNNDVVISQLLTPPVLLTPVAILYIIGQVVFNEDFSFFSVASMITALAATIFTPIMRTLNFWDFRLGRTPDGKLRIKHGLLTTRSQTVPIHRIQSITVTWPFLWRLKGWLRVTIAVAGQSSSAEEGRKAETDRLLPVATLAQAHEIVPLAVHGADPSNLPFTTVVPRAKWIAPLRSRVLAAGLTEHVFGSVDGRVTRTLTMVPYERIQSIRITQGPLQRRLGLATVHADVAGGTPVSAPHRTLEQAYAWVGELERRTFTARSAAS